MNRINAVLIGILISPILLTLALLIRRNLGKPVFFKQIRPGLQGNPFQLYKFRTMKDIVDSEGMLLPDSDRLTKFGSFLRKFSLDEPPQLWNVIKGEMNFIGPRPLLMEYLPLYTREQSRRHEIKPGITGWSQVNGRNAIGWEEKFKLDIWYVDHRSFLIDLKILWLTLRKVIQSEGIASKGQATMEKFSGSNNK